MSSALNELVEYPLLPVMPQTEDPEELRRYIQSLHNEAFEYMRRLRAVAVDHESRLVAGGL